MVRRSTSEVGSYTYLVYSSRLWDREGSTDVWSNRDADLRILDVLVTS